MVVAVVVVVVVVVVAVIVVVVVVEAESCIIAAELFCRGFVHPGYGPLKLQNYLIII